MDRFVSNPLHKVGRYVCTDRPAAEAGTRGKSCGRDRCPTINKQKEQLERLGGMENTLMYGGNNSSQGPEKEKKEITARRRTVCRKRYGERFIGQDSVC